ncbi:hypothetical protein LSS_03209 [Leptospira santarosai serovar Shermani str. LT 821]|uniref:Uncharacterized protein n=1 Tax=Leptospira santarosai serovar Shermani str. LT 821 TaxID=758847 RepID=K8Y5W2_9LEPT|nr:Uncharacterized protein XB17_00036 [Leptospira santarosai]EKT88366.1 hypothetical protein LSS_03209 [Leptospira santarosai serovar Shermani str. LT 821]
MSYYYLQPPVLHYRKKTIFTRIFGFFKREAK